MRLEWLYEARCELEQLVAQCRASQGPQAAQALARRILYAVNALSRSPRAGVLRRDTLLGRHGFRALLVDRFVCVYRIEEDAVRVYHLTDAEDGDLYQILGIVSRETDQEVRSMRNNVFLKSTLRQPMRTALLLAVAALITFAFVSRCAQYLLVRQETDRLGSFYRATGTLQSSTGDRWADTAEAVSYLEDNPHVHLVNTFHHTSAVMEEDFCNADISGTSPPKTPSYFYFYGTLYDWDNSSFYFTVDTVLAGYPEIVEAGDQVTLFKSARQKANVPAFNETVAQLERGGRYLAMGYYRPNVDPQCRVERQETPGGVQRTTYACLACLSSHGYFYPMARSGEADWNSPQLRPLPAEAGYPVKDYIQYTRDTQRTLNIIPIRDMSALPAVQDPAAGIYLTDGRWLDSQDDRQGRRVCVVNAAFASMRGLAVGDTLTLRLQDIPSHFGYLQNLEEIQDDLRTIRSARTATDTYEIVGLYEYLGQYPGSEVRNFTYLPASAVPETFHMTTQDNVWPELFEMYFFETFNPDTTAFFPGEVSFVLRSPREEAQFMAETRSDLARMGFEAVMTENGWENFQAAAEPMRRSSLLSAAIFSALLLATACLLALLYYRMRRRDIAIARAMGVPAGRCARDVCLPLALVGALGTAAGGILGWLYTLRTAAGTLSALGQSGGEASPALSGWWLAALTVMAFALLLAAGAAGAAYLCTRSVLRLLQGGGTAAGAAVQAAPREPGPLPNVPQGSGPLHGAPQPGISLRSAPQRSGQPQGAPERPGPVPRQVTGVVHAPSGMTPAAAPGRGGAAHVLCFVWRHMVRAKAKSGLAVLLAAGFTVGLAAIRLSIAGSQDRINWLYENTCVEAELLQADASQSVRGGGFLRQDTVQALLDSGYVRDVYLEGSASGAVTRYSQLMASGGAVNVGREDKIDMAIRALSDEETFLSPAGSGGAVTITYLDGWDGSLFSREWAADEPFPVVLPKTAAAYPNSENLIGLSCRGFRVCQVAGYYEGTVAGSGGETAPVLIPLQVYQQIGSLRAVAYSKVHIALDPSLNRKLESFNQLLTRLSASQGTGLVALRAVIWDEELRLAVAPLESSVVLMRVLFPVTLALSLLAAAGIAVLFVMTSAKEAAIMRVLGTSRLRSRVMLTLQNVFTNAAGLLLGLAGVLAFTAGARPELLGSLLGTGAVCALLYLIAAALGAAMSAAGVTGRNPLELLQIKE